MNTLRSTRHALGLALLGGLASVIAAEVLPAITISATREATIQREGRSASTGAPIEVISLTRRVSYADLNLGTHSGAVELEKRVNDAALATCKQLDSLYPQTIKDNAACAKQAAAAAMPQVTGAVTAAEKKSTTR